MPLHTALRVVSGLALFLDACDTVLNLDGVFSFSVYFSGTVLLGGQGGYFPTQFFRD